ncbi:hypothetical protein Tco_0343392, partial [Tanacetum coccineum]
MGTVHFRNDHFAVITGYKDYIQGNLTFCNVYYGEGLGHNLFPVRQFYDGDLEVAFRSNTSYVRNLEGDDSLMGSRDSNLYTISISEMAASSPHNKTPYELIRGRKSNIQYFHVFGSLCYPTNDRNDLGKMKPKADIVSDDSAANTIDDDHTSSSSSIVVDQDDAPQVVSSSDEQFATASTSPVMNEVADEFIQEDVVDFDGTMFHDAPQTFEFEVAKSSSKYQDPSNMHQFHQQHRSTDRWTKNHPL